MTTTNVSSTHTYTPGYDSLDDQEIDKKVIHDRSRDLTIALVVQPLFVVLIIGRRTSDGLPTILFVCRIVGNFVFLVSTITVTLIAMDRYLKLISAKFNNNNIMNKEKTIALARASGFACVSSFLNAILYQKTTLYFLATVIGLCFVIIIVCYTVICYQVCKDRPFSHSRAAKTRTDHDREEEIQDQAVDQVSQLQFVGSVGMVLLAFLIGKIVPSVYRTFTDPVKDYGEMYFTAVTASLCCSVVNPALYCFDNKRYRQAFKQLLCSLTLRKTERTDRENHSSEITA